VIIKALKPLSLKKNSGLLTGLLTHKIVQDTLEPDSSDIVNFFYRPTHSKRIFFFAPED
jgi:hypothetical protein